MKTAATLLFCAGCLALSAQDAEIVCTDGSSLRGRLLSIGSDRLEIDAAFLAEPVPLRMDRVLSVTLASQPAETQGDHVAVLTLSNGDSIRGELTGVSAETISIRTWYAGELTFRRAMVDRVEIHKQLRLIYFGPDDLSAWSHSREDTWVLDSGWFRANRQGTISRKFDLPDQIRIAFDYSWRSNPQFGLQFFSDLSDTTQSDNSYDMTIQGGRLVHFRKFKDGDEFALGNFAQVPEFVNGERCRLEILADRKAGRIRLIVNGRIVQDLIDLEPNPGQLGGGIQFTSFNRSLSKISRIEISSWDGVLEGKAPLQDEGMLGDEELPFTETAPAIDPSRIRLRNDDQIAGNVEGVEGGRVRIRAPFGEIKIPVARLRTFAIHSDDDRKNPEIYQFPIRRLGDVRAWFPDGGRITFRLLAADAENLTGDSQTFGNAVFSQKAFSRIEFNLYDPDLEKLRKETSAP